MDNNTYCNFLDLVKARYSCRKYLSTPVDRETIMAVLETARLAPSACNRQPWQYVVADTPELCKEIAGCYGRDWVDNVPVFVVAIGDHDQAWHRAEDSKDHTDVDLSIAVEHICLAATAAGLGSCWICNFDEPRLRETLNLPDNLEAIAIIPLGYPDPESAVPEKKRKASEEIIRWGKF